MLVVGGAHHRSATTAPTVTTSQMTSSRITARTTTRSRDGRRTVVLKGLIVSCRSEDLAEVFPILHREIGPFAAAAVDDAGVLDAEEAVRLGVFDVELRIVADNGR